MREASQIFASACFESYAVENVFKPFADLVNWCSRPLSDKVFLSLAPPLADSPTKSCHHLDLASSSSSSSSSAVWTPAGDMRRPRSGLLLGRAGDTVVAIGGETGLPVKRTAEVLERRRGSEWVSTSVRSGDHVGLLLFMVETVGELRKRTKQ